MNAQHLEFPDDTFETVPSSFVSVQLRARHAVTSGRNEEETHADLLDIFLDREF